jgi:ribonuclease-3
LTPEELAERLGLEGPLPHLLEALTHPSWANEQRRDRHLDNQRLEFLGDAVLGVCTTEVIMERFPHADEGELSLVRSTLVSAEALATWARSVDLGSALRLGRGADLARERDQRNVLADAVEAVVGAVHLDLGLEAARALVRAVVAEGLARCEAAPTRDRDAKSALQELVQATGAPAPAYRVVGTGGPDHDRQFDVAVEVHGEPVASGRGRSKKAAEQAAARAALDVLAARAAAEGTPVASSPEEGDSPGPAPSGEDEAS